MRGSRTRAPVVVAAALAGVGAALGGALGGGEARAVDNFDAQIFKPACDPFGFVTVDGARTLSFLEPHFALFFNWAHNPLKLDEPRPGGQGRDVVHELSTFDLTGSIGVFSFGRTGGVEVGADLPYAVDIGGKVIEVDPITGESKNLRVASFGDLRASLKVTALDREKDEVGVAVIAELEVPTGRDDVFLSNKKAFTPSAALILEKKWSYFRFGLEAGYELISGDIKTGGLKVDDKIKLGGAIAYAPWDMKRTPVEFIVEAWHWTRAGHPWNRMVESPIELGGAVKYSSNAFGLIGGSAGMNNGVGAPDVRVFAAVGATF